MVPCFNVNVVLLTPVTASLNVTVGRMLVATPVAPDCRRLPHAASLVRVYSSTRNTTTPTTAPA